MIGDQPDAKMVVVYHEVRPIDGAEGVHEVEARMWWAEGRGLRYNGDAVIEVRRTKTADGVDVEVARYLANGLSRAQVARRAIELFDQACASPVDAPLPSEEGARLAIEAQLSRAWADLAALKLAASAAVEILDNVDLFAPATEKTLRRDIEEAGDKLCRALEGIATVFPAPVY